MVGTRVYVGGLSYKVCERDIDRFFKNFNGLGDIVIKNGFAFVEFDDQREADDAIYEMNGKELMGGRVTVERARGTPRTGGGGSGGGGRWARNGGGGGGRGPPQRQRFGMPSRTKYRLKVENLSSKVSWQDLKDFMRQAGEVTYADAHKHRTNEGVIEFATRSDMRNALIKLDNKDLRGRRIRLYDETAGDRKSRSRSRSRSRSKSRSMSRSVSRGRSRSRSRSPRSRSGSRGNQRSRSRSMSRSVSRSPVNQRSRSKSMSASPDAKDRRASPHNSRSRGGDEDDDY